MNRLEVNVDVLEVGVDASKVGADMLEVGMDSSEGNLDASDLNTLVGDMEGGNKDNSAGDNVELIARKKWLRYTHTLQGPTYHLINH